MGKKSQPASRAASSAPATCETIKSGTELGAIPEKLFVRALATVTAGLAKLVEAVNQ
jgi:hypothetical protein